MDKLITLHCDHMIAITNTKDSRHHKRSNHIIWGFVESGDVTIVKITSNDNLSNPFTKTQLSRSFERHIKSMKMRNMLHLHAWRKWEIVRIYALRLNTIYALRTF